MTFIELPLNHRVLPFLLLITLSCIVMGCGGGGGGGGSGGGGGGQQGGTGGQGGILLTEISFPTSTNLTGATSDPPTDAPLGQQIIFTFSDVPDCPDRIVIDDPKVFDALKVYALVPSGYNGPDVVVDMDTSTIPARGIFEKIGNLIVFTPFFPTEPLSLISNASKEAVPGLLPDIEYIIYVTTSVNSSIKNLAGTGGSVTNPLKFTTGSAELPNLFFANHPAAAPEVVSTYPQDGDVDVPVNPYDQSIPGFPAQTDFYVTFDEPLHYGSDNIVGEDLDNDSIDEENLFFSYTEPTFYAALDGGTTNDAGLYRIDRSTGAATFLGVTFLTSPSIPIGLNSIVLDGQGTMLGTNGAALVEVEYRNLQNPLQCRLSNPVNLIAITAARGLTFGPDGALYAVNSTTGEVVTIDPATGIPKLLHDLGTAYGTYMDLVVRPDGLVYIAGVQNSGLPNAQSTLLEIDLDADPVAVTVLLAANADYTSICLKGFDKLALYSGPGLFVDLFDLDQGAIMAGARYSLTGGLDDGSRLNINYSVAELGTWCDVTENTYQGSKVVLKPSGILPFGEEVQILVRRGLDNISFGNKAEHQNPLIQARQEAEADLIATFTTYDPGAGAVSDLFYEDFLDTEWEGSAIVEGLPPANWAVDDVDGEAPEYEHLLATYGLGGGGGLGDFLPQGIYPTVILDTDYQTLPLYDGSTPGVKKHTVVTGGVFNFENIIIPAGVTVVAMGSNPLVLNATGRVQIAGIIDVSGAPGANDITFDSAFTPVPGGIGGPGGGRGGVSHPAMPANFQNLTDLRTPFKAEDGWGYSNKRQNGGRGAESGASGTDTKYKGGSGGRDPDSRAAGGGGGSFLQEGGMGYHGFGPWGADPDSPDRYFMRDTWWFDNGNPVPVLGVDQYWTQDTPGGQPGDLPFIDSDVINDFIGSEGELKFLRGGQGGGGGGTRADSMNPATIGLASGWWPPVDRSAYDSKGGGGGGGGGAIGIYALDEIVIEATGTILARGGIGGGGEVIGHSNFGGGAGGGSGGAIILDSADTIHIKTGAVVDVSGGWPGDGKEVVKYTVSALTGNLCLNNNSSFHKASFCSWSVGDGGYGGHGLVQLQVSDYQSDLVIDDPNSVFAEICEVDWAGTVCLGKNSITNPHCGCTEGGDNCARTYMHYKVNYDTANKPSLPVSQDCLIDPAKTPTTLGPLSYGLSKWIDMGQVVHRDPIGSTPTPVFLGFEGIDPVTGTVITQNGYLPNPQSLDISVNAPDWNLGTANYIPERNEVIVEFQGADAITPGSKVPDEDSYSAWTADIQSLSGKQFVRFRVCLNTAKEPFSLTPTSPKPQVDFVRIRLQY